MLYVDAAVRATSSQVPQENAMKRQEPRQPTNRSNMGGTERNSGVSPGLNARTSMKTPVGMNIREPFHQILDMDFPVRKSLVLHVVSAGFSHY